MTDQDYEEILDALYIELSAWGNCETPLHTLLVDAYCALKRLVDERRGNALLVLGSPVPKSSPNLKSPTEFS